MPPPGGVHDLLPRVTEDRGAPRLAEIDVPRAVGVLQVRAFASNGEPRHAADGAEGAHR